MFDAEQILVVEESNTLLIEEFKYANVRSNLKQQYELDTKFFDDLINALMIAAYIAKKRRYIDRVSHERTKDVFKEEMSLYGFKRKSGSSQTYF